MELIGTSSPRLPVTMPRILPKIGDPSGVLDGKSGWRQRARHRPTTSHSPSWDGERCPTISSNIGMKIAGNILEYWNEYWNEDWNEYWNILERTSVSSKSTGSQVLCKSSRLLCTQGISRSGPFGVKSSLIPCNNCFQLKVLNLFPIESKPPNIPWNYHSPKVTLQ